EAPRQTVQIAASDSCLLLGRCGHAAAKIPEWVSRLMDPGCVKTRRCGEQIEWTFRQITIRVMRILKRGQFRSIRERSFFSFSSFRGFHTAWVISLGSDRGRGPVYVRIPPIASEFCAPQRKTPSATCGLMQCSKTPVLGCTPYIIRSTRRR